MTKKHILPKDAWDLCIIKTELFYLTEEPCQTPLTYTLQDRALRFHTHSCPWAIKTHEFDFEWRKGHFCASVSRQQKVDQLESESGQLTTVNIN